MLDELAEDFSDVVSDFKAIGNRVFDEFGMEINVDLHSPYECAIALNCRACDCPMNELDEDCGCDNEAGKKVKRLLRRLRGHGPGQPDD